MQKENIKPIISKLTDTILTQLVEEMQKKHIQDKINQQLLNPIIDEINKRIYPYFLIFSILIILILILILIIFFLNIK